MAGTLYDIAFGGYMQEIYLKINSLSPILLSLFGLIFSVAGGLLVSIEAFGIKESLAYRNDGIKHHARRTDVHLNAMVNQASVFFFVNLVWFFILVYILSLPIAISLILYFWGYYIWKFIIWAVNLVRDYIYKLDALFKKGRGCFYKLIMLPFGVLWLISYVGIYLLSIIIEFGIDLPFRFIGEKLIAKIVLKIFDKIYLLLKGMEHDVFKTPVLLGAVFLIIGFIYQLAGTILLLVIELNK